MGRQKKRKHWTACAHCGEPGEKFTRDHVPPKGLFNDASNLVIVPSCLECNNGADKDEEYFRAALLRFWVPKHPEAKKMVPTVRRSLARPDHQGMALALSRPLKLADLYTASGLWYGKAPVPTGDEVRLERVIRKIVRGLIWHHLGHKPLHADWGIWMCWEHQYPIAKMNPHHPPFWAALTQDSPQTLGNGAFEYNFAQAADVPEGSLWLLKFYGQVEVFCATIGKWQMTDEYRARAC